MPVSEQNNRVPIGKRSQIEFSGVPLVKENQNQHGESWINRLFRLDFSNFVQGISNSLSFNNATRTLFSTINGVTSTVVLPIWNLLGNSGTVQSTNFLGTTDNVGLSFRTNNVIRQTITNTGNIGIGTTTPISTFQVNGSVAETVTVITATTTLNETHNKILLQNGATAITITLPNALTCLGRKYEFSRYAGSTGGVTILPSGGQIQALNGTVGATTSIGLHSAAGLGLRHSFTAVNIGGVGVWVRL